MNWVDSPPLTREHQGEDFLEFGEDDKEDFKDYEINRGGNVFSCSLHTGLNFTSCEELHTHVSKHWKQYICDECNKACTPKYNLKNHVQTKHRGVTPQVKCTIAGCDAVFCLKNGFYKHYNWEHKCETCKKIFSCLPELEEHCCGVVEKPSVCKFCSKEFKTSQTCKRHIEESCLSNPEVKSKQYPYKCDICGDSFHEKNNLLKHTESVHGRRGNKYQCPKCSASFPNRELAGEHIKTFH